MRVMKAFPQIEEHLNKLRKQSPKTAHSATD
jgi:hypothetical protein